MSGADEPRAKDGRAPNVFSPGGWVPSSDPGSPPLGYVTGTSTFTAQTDEVRLRYDHLPPGEGTIAVTLGGVIAVRGEHFAFTAERELASMLMGTRRGISIERSSEIEAIFAEAPARPAMNLLQQDFAPGQNTSKWMGYRRVAALAAVAALSPVAIWTAEIVRSEAAARDLETRAEATARTIIGDAQALDPIGALRGRVAGLRANEGFMQTTAALFEAMSRMQGVELQSLSYLQDGVIRATLIHNGVSEVGSLRGALEENGVVVDEDAAHEHDGRMVTTITLNRRS